LRRHRAVDVAIEKSATGVGVEIRPRQPSQNAHGVRVSVSTPVIW
jgi:hypothetical protein